MSLCIYVPNCKSKLIYNILRIIQRNTSQLFRNLHIPPLHTSIYSDKKLQKDSNLWLVQPGDIAKTFNWNLRENLCLPFDVQISLILSQSQQFSSTEHKPSRKSPCRVFHLFQFILCRAAIGVTDYRERHTPLLFSCRPEAPDEHLNTQTPLFFICCFVKIIFFTFLTSTEQGCVK